MIKAYGIVAALLLTLAGGAAASQYSFFRTDSAAAPGKKCECFDGDARCFFDGSRCPVSGGKCKCFQAPSVAVASAETADFCSATCPKVVGGEKCGAQCRLKSGHSGRHLCLKLHDF